MMDPRTRKGIYNLMHKVHDTALGNWHFHETLRETFHETRATVLNVFMETLHENSPRETPRNIPRQQATTQPRWCGRVGERSCWGVVVLGRGRDG
eukprot:4812731-Pyramimonas_sp.AAC.1